MSVFLLVDTETRYIDKYTPSIDFTSTVVTQGDTPGEDLQVMNPERGSHLPDPSTGGAFGSRILNGFSNGIRSLTNRTQPFSGAVARPPAISNPVQGDVGINNRQSKTYAGAVSQLSAYQPSEQSYFAKWLGVMPTGNGKSS
jgi:hypothetical protein